jgi:hypothetical protein
MKKTLFTAVAVAICVVLIAIPLKAATASADAKPAGHQTPGVELAYALSTITGVAISPLFGVGTVGAWKYFHTPEENRARLPWFAQPAFWIPALIVVGLVAAKDIFGTAAPTALKKPFDIAETIENKVSGLIMAGAFVPLIASVFGEEVIGEGAMLSSMGLAAIDLSWVGNAIAIPLAIVIFLFVFLLGHAINVLIILSPFTTVDAGLKLARLALLASVPATAMINPWLGAVWALAIIVVAYLVAGWTFRLSHFGAVFVWDYFTLRRKRFTPDKVENKMFLARAASKVPIRTYGKLVRNGMGKLVFSFRPWLVLPRRTLELPDARYEAGRGVFYSEIRRFEGEETRAVLLLPPRYLGHEAQLAEIYGLSGVRDVGIRAAWRWLKGMFGMKPQPAAA